MNYRHDFHAGNFADVLKHIVLTRILLHLTKKDTPLRFIDTHAGSGFYDLHGAQAEKTAEWRNGLGRLLQAGGLGSPSLPGVIEPYVKLVFPAIEPGLLYPGSPAIAAALLRPQDRLLLCELHPDAAQDLRLHLGRDRRTKILEIDGFMGLNAFVPPVERRGLVLIDPAFEARDDLPRSLDLLQIAWRKWPTGVYMLWYPLKDRQETERFLRPLARGAMRRVLRIEFHVAAPMPLGPLVANGLLIVNPPYPLVGELEIVLPYLAHVLGERSQPAYRLEWLAPEEPA
jgi:23S rRNA (adenine2030-N6)-methyltransferase